MRETLAKSAPNRLGSKSRPLEELQRAYSRRSTPWPPPVTAGSQKPGRSPQQKHKTKTAPRRRADATPDDATQKDERPRETTTRRKPARADARAALDEAAWRPRIVGPFATIIRTAARVGDVEMFAECDAPFRHRARAAVRDN